MPNATLRSALEDNMWNAVLTTGALMEALYGYRPIIEMESTNGPLGLTIEIRQHVQTAPDKSDRCFRRVFTWTVKDRIALPSLIYRELLALDASISEVTFGPVQPL